MGGRRRRRNTAKTGDRALYRTATADDDDGAPASNNGGKVGHGRSGDGDADDEDDPLHDEVDRYHLSRARREEEELIRLDDDGDGGGEEEDDDDDGIVKNREGVFDLGVGASSSSEDDSEEEASSEEEEEGRGRSKADGSPSSASSSSSSSDDDSSSSDDDDDEEDGGGPNTIGDVLDWGRSKRSYYQTGGDTDPTLKPDDQEDDEDAEGKDDAILEEEAGREVQRLRLKDMDEDDFLLEDFDGGGDGGAGAAVDDDDRDDAPPKSKGGRKTRATPAASSGAGGLFEAFDDFTTSNEDVDVMGPSTPDLAGMTDEERFERLASAHPEFLPLVRHFAHSALSPLATDGAISVASRHLLPEDGDGDGGDASGRGRGQADAEAVGATPMGLEYLRTKRLILMSTVLNLVSYLLLKRDSVKNGGDTLDVRNHPVIARLNELQGLNDTLREGVEVPFDLDGQLDTLGKAAELMVNDEDGNDDEADVSSEEGDSDEESSAGGPRGTDGGEAPAVAENAGTVSPASSPSSSDEDVEDRSGATSASAAAALNEARFAVRWGEDFDENEGVQRRKKKKRRRRATETTMERRRGGGAEGDYGDYDEDEEGEEEDALRARASRALSATVNSIAQRERTRSRRRRPVPDGGDAEAGTNDEGGYRGSDGLEVMEEEEMLLGKASSDEDDDVVDRELVDDDVSEDDDAYYHAVRKRASAKKASKRAKYAVAPKYPSIEEEVRGERAASKTIMKNRGLVPHKNKLARNPRVKKREQYRKALIRRRGAVRELRKPEEGERYGGELTGIKTGLSRSRKLGVR